MHPPKLPATPPAPTIPVVGMLAPLAASVLIALILQSPLAIVFGLLGPVIALASWWEALRAHRRTIAATQDVYEQELLEQERERLEGEERYRRECGAFFPPIDEALTNPLWRPAASPAPPLIRIGLGMQSPAPGEMPIHGVPVTTTVERGLALVGEGPEALALWRAIVLATLVLAKHRSWEDSNSHIDRDADPPDALAFRVRDTDAVVSLTRVGRPSEVAHGVSTVIGLRAGSAELIHDGMAIQKGIVPDHVSFSAWRHLLGSSGLLDTVSPESGHSSDDGSDCARTQLWARLSPDFSVDLVTEGPHALVWGQTGSGKTIAVQTLLRSVAARYTPEQVTFAMVDFKGGTGLSDLADCDHLVGSLTDLDPHLVGRVAMAIEAQILRREENLAAHRVADIAQLAPSVELPRLILVIDEVAHLLQRHPEWESLLSDVASRGRALGIHLVVSGQRLVGQVPRTVVVNAPIRVCMRVLDAAEASEFLPGAASHALSALQHSPTGTFLGLTSSRALTTSRVDMSVPTPVRTGRSIPLWREPLPTLLTPQHPLVSGEATWAVADEPAQARYQALTSTDVPHGLCVLLGEGGMGHTGALHAIAHSVGPTRRIWLPDKPAQWVDAVFRLRRGERPSWLADSGPICVVTDRLDRIFRDHTVDQRDWVADLLSELSQALSDSSPRSSCIVTVATHSEWVRPVLRRCSSVIALSGAQVDSLSGPAASSPSRGGIVTPGRAWWDGREVQFVARSAPDQATRWPLEGDGPESLPMAARGGVLVHPPTLVAPVVEGWSTLSITDAEVHWREIEQARLNAELALCGLSRDQAKVVSGALGALLPPAPSGQAWLMGLEGPRLVGLAENRPCTRV